MLGILTQAGAKRMANMSTSNPAHQRQNYSRFGQILEKPEI